ncbi:hypothetical protein [Sphingomonas turrisvirgatae]|uniref:Uncharacterized protein n=1 Tax=Sphingomonas turrisvirgatae TaxID=1888892 RepID=A0A1E3LTK9_9SPHN|nr:hypothetical protein [Sphingomonas turrisvirgatae]ODP36525.1 hypothetical protein BFL28_05955 [Sphingomonas turrisvirgatae]
MSASTRNAVLRAEADAAGTDTHRMPVTQRWRFGGAAGVSLTFALLAGGLAGLAWRRGRRKRACAGFAPDGTQAQLEAMVRRASSLLGPAPDLRTGRSRPEAERLHQVIDAQGPLMRDGKRAPLAEPLPDAVPMTGEEDPIVEVDDPEFVEIVAEFMRSERHAKVRHDGTARAQLAHALLPFADINCEPTAVICAIDGPFTDFIDSLTTRAGAREPHAADRLLVATLASMVARAGNRGPCRGAKAG